MPCVALRPDQAQRSNAARDPCVAVVEYGDSEGFVEGRGAEDLVAVATVFRDLVAVEVGDPAAATNNLLAQAQFTLTAEPDAAGPTQVLTRTASEQVFLVVRYSLEP